MQDNTVAPDGTKNPAGEPRFEEQCYLLWNWSAFNKNNISTTYDNFAVIMGEPTDVINRLTAKKGIESIFSIKPYQLSALVPKIRIFKVSYANSEEGETQELNFSDHTSAQSIENITKTRFGRGDGIGIQSFDYDLTGGTESGGSDMVKKGITKVNIRFLFQNIEMLVQRQPGQPALVDLISLPPNTQPGQLNKTAPTCPEGGGLNISNLWDTKRFAMKVVYGWADPDTEFINPEMRDVIRGSTNTLLVNVQRHTLNFNEDGTVILEAEFNGYSDSALEQPESDLLWLDDERQQTLNMKKAEVDDAKQLLDKNKKDKKDAEKAQKEGTGSEDDVEAIEGKEKEIAKEGKAAEEAYDAAAASNKIFVYQRLLNAIHTSGKIYYIDLTAEDVEKYNADVKAALSGRAAGSTSPTEKELAEMSPADRDAAEKEVADGNQGPQIEKKVADADDTGIQDTSANVEKAVEGALENPDDLKKGLNEFNKENLTQTLKAPDDKRINYIYYGDLLDVAFSVLKKNPAASNIRAMIGPISFTDPHTGTKTIINLADVAISLNKFLEWFNNNVVGMGRSEYLLQDFLKDSIKDLIHAALGEDCFPGTGAPTPQPNVTIQNLVIPGTGAGGKEERIPVGGRINVDSISTATVGEIIPNAENKGVASLFTYVYIYSYSFSMSDLKGDPVADAQRGIHHLHIGGDSGIVKSIKFNRVDQPALAAHRATSQACDLRHLREQYTADIEMIGNSIFKPGQFIYINPSMMGVGSPQTRTEITEALGLGGYYTVNKVSGDLSAGGYNTTVHAIRQADTVDGSPATMGGAGTASNEGPVDAA